MKYGPLAPNEMIVVAGPSTNGRPSVRSFGCMPVARRFIDEDKLVWPKTFLDQMSPIFCPHLLISLQGWSSDLYAI